MGWFNYYGLIAIIVIMIPNILSMLLKKDMFANSVSNKFLIIFEQVGRYGCMLFMVFNIPYLYFGFWFENAEIAYITAGASIILIYFLGWIIFWNKNGMAKAIWLSVTPSLLFVFCGIMLSNIPLMLSAVVFSVCHIVLSVCNVQNSKIS